MLVIAAWALVGRTPLATARPAPPWAWIGGLYGAFFVAAVAFAAPRPGVAFTLTLTIGAQLTAAVLFDHLDCSDSIARLFRQRGCWAFC